MIGDRLLTDVLTANMYHMKSVLVSTPISLAKDPVSVQMVWLSMISFCFATLFPASVRLAAWKQKPRMLTFGFHILDSLDSKMGTTFALVVCSTVKSSRNAIFVCSKKAMHVNDQIINKSKPDGIWWQMAILGSHFPMTDRAMLKKWIEGEGEGGVGGEGREGGGAFVKRDWCVGRWNRNETGNETCASSECAQYATMQGRLKMTSPSHHLTTATTYTTLTSLAS